mgnify:CR=1 FL=1|jgi:hypothetical protein
MSLIDDLAKENPNDPINHIERVPLTKEEELGLNEMFRSPSWDLLTTKIWPKALKLIVLKALTAPADQRFYQGMFLGYKHLVDSANEFKNGVDEKIMEQLQENINDPTGYDSSILH